MNKKVLAVVLMIATCCMVFAGGKKDAKTEAKSEKVVLRVWESTGGPDEFIKKQVKHSQLNILTFQLNL